MCVRRAHAARCPPPAASLPALHLGRNSSRVLTPCGWRVQVDALERILTRVALTEDAQLEGVLAKLLPRIIEKLATPHARVRNVRAAFWSWSGRGARVGGASASGCCQRCLTPDRPFSAQKTLEILSHTNKRVRDHAQITLPLAALVGVFENSAGMVRNFALVYVELAFERADDAGRLAVVTQLLRGVAGASAAHKAMVLRLAVRALEPHADLTASARLLGPDATPEAVRAAFPFLDAGTADGVTFWHFALDVMLSRPHMPPAAPAPVMGLANSQPAPQVAAPDATATSPAPGLSIAAAASVDGKAPAPAASLQRRKLALLNLSAAAETAPRTCMMVYLAAAADTGLPPVASRGEELLRRRVAMDTVRPTVDLEDSGVIGELIRVFLGDDVAIMGTDNARTPASTALRIRILAALCRSMAATRVGDVALSVLNASLGNSGQEGQPQVSAPPRLRAAGMEFAVWTLRHAPTEVLTPLAPSVMAALTAMLDERESSGGAAPCDGAGAATGSHDTHGSMVLRSFAYSALGQLASRMPGLVAATAAVATQVITALASEPAGVRASAAEAASALCSAYATAASQEVRASLKGLLCDGLTQQHSPDGVRAASVRWLNALYPFSDPQCRALCIAAAGDAKLEVREAAQGGLKPQTPSQHYPPLDAMLAVLQTSHPRLAAATQALSTPAGAATHSHSAGQQPLLLPPHAMSAGITFLRACRAADTQQQQGQLAPPGYRAFCELALMREAPAEVWHLALSALRDDAAAAPEAAAALYSTRTSWLRGIAAHTQADVRRAVAQMLAAAGQGMSPADRVGLVTSLAAVVSAGPGAPAADAPGAISVGKLTYEEVDASACALGYILARSGASPEECVTGVGALMRALRTASKDMALAGTAAAALGHAGLMRPLPLPDGVAPAAGSAGTTNAAGEAVTKAAVVAHLCSLLRTAKETHVQSRAARALGHLCAGDPTCEVVTHQAVEALLSCAEAAAKAEPLMFAAGDALAAVFAGMRADAQTAELMGEGSSTLAVGGGAEEEDEGDDGDAVMGEAAAVVVTAAPVDDPPARVAVQSTILGKLLGTLAVSTRPGDRCCASAWLLALVARAQVAGSTTSAAAPPTTRWCLHPALVPRVGDMQRAFSALLGDANDVTQDLAAQGLSAMHRAGDAGTRATLVAALVATLTGDPSARGATTSIKVDADSTVFEKGALGTDAPVASSAAAGTKQSSSAAASGGGALSTYKELCSLATEMGQPDLIYRFMEMANHAKAMSAKRGAAFGVARLAGGAAARKLLQPHMATLVPRLFRMRHDPSPGVQEAAHAIWDAAVVPCHKDARAAVEAHMVTILRECTSELGSRLWRAREAACGALVEALTGRQWEEVAQRFGEMWTMALRALDDIKDSVRVAATSLARSLSALTVRLCNADGDETKQAASEALNCVIPILLSTGVPSPAAEVRGLAVRTLCQLAEKAAPEAIQPHLGDVVFCVLEALSSLEDQRVSYIAHHAPALGVDAQSLDAARVAASQGGALGDTLERCLKHCSAPEALASVVPRVAALAKSGTGLATRAGTARFATSLCVRVPGGIGSAHSSTLLTAFSAAMQSEANAGVRGAYASAAAAACRQAPPQKVAAAVTAALASLAPEAEADAAAMLRGGVFVRALSRDAPDVLAPLLSGVLPAAFVAKHSAETAAVKGSEPGTAASSQTAPDPVTVAASVWAEVWDANTGAERASLRLYAPDIAQRCISQLNASAWTRKRAGAAAAGALAKGLAPPPSSGPDAAFTAVAPGLAAALLAALPGRIWDGKEHVLGALADVVDSAPDVLAPQAHAMVTSAMAAAGRRARAFRTAALGCVARILKRNPQYDAWDTVAPFLLLGAAQPPASQAAPVGDKAAAAAPVVDPEDGPIPPPPAADSLSTLAAAWASAAPVTKEQHSAAFAAAVATALGLDRDWRVRTAACEAARAQCGSTTPPAAGIVAATALVPQLVANLSDPTAASLRTAAIEALGLAVPFLWADTSARALADQALTALRSTADADVNSGVRGTAARVETALRAGQPVDRME